MRYIHLIFIVILLMMIRCKTLMLQERNSLLNYTQLYVYDNRSDTIIKNYELFDTILSSVPLHVDTTNTLNNFAPMFGSILVESIHFYKNSTGTIVTLMDREMLKHESIHQEQRKVNDPNEILHNVIISGDSISFYRGVFNGPMICYSGIVYPDSLKLNLSLKLNNHIMKFNRPDSVRVYILK